MATKETTQTSKDFYCLNCHQPFISDEKFCSACGQKNQGKKIAFKKFVRDIFAGFFSWDAKFWRTLKTLLFNPGKISKDYNNGKRIHYSNPFRFYLTASIIFFIAYGVRDKYDAIVNTENISSQINFNQYKFDSIKKNIQKELQVELQKEAVNMDSLFVKLDTIFDNVTKKKKNFTFIKDSKMDRFISYNIKHPEATPKEVFENLGYKDSFVNHFLFNRAKLINSFFEDKNNTKTKGKQFINKMLSYGSISLFILLPIFALFFKLYYFRHRYTYIEHLIFVFHTQTVFYILLTPITIASTIGFSGIASFISLLFPIYLFIALKKFYGQTIFKTFLKFCLLNITYVFVISFGIIGVVIISLMLF